MDPATGIIAALAALLIFIAYRRGDATLAAGWAGTWSAILRLGPLLLGILVVIGFSEVLLPRELIVRWLGRESGLRGILIACGLGALTPGGPFVSFPLVATLYRAGAGVGPLVAFTTAWSLWAVSRLPLELSVVGVRLTLVRMASTLLFPPLAGWIADQFFSRFV